MSEVKIGERAKSVLSSFSKLNPSLRVRQDYLFARCDKVTGVFTLPAGEIETDVPFVVFSVPMFMSILGMFENPVIHKDDLVLSIQDGNKKVVYLATDDCATPERQTGGEQLFDSHEKDAMFTCLLDEKVIKDINTAISAIDANAMSFVCANGEVSLKVENESSENYVEIKLSGSSSEDIQIDMGDKTLLPSLFSGIYAVQCRKCIHNEGELYLTKFVNQSIKADEGSLFYFAPMSKK